MSWFESVSPKSLMPDSAKPTFDAAAMIQLGAMSPLWALYIGASTAGMAYWSMTRWMRLATPEKMSAQVFKLRLVEPVPPPVAEPKAVVEPMVKAAEDVADLKIPQPAVPEFVEADPVVAEVGKVSVVMPEAVAEVAAATAPAIVKARAPKPVAVAKPKPVKPVLVKASAPKPVEVKKAVQKSVAKAKPLAVKAPIVKAPAPKAASVADKATPVKAKPVAVAEPVKPAAKAPAPRRKAAVKTAGKSKPKT